MRREGVAVPLERRPERPLSPPQPLSPPPLVGLEGPRPRRSAVEPGGGADSDLALDT